MDDKEFKAFLKSIKFPVGPRVSFFISDGNNEHSATWTKHRSPSTPASFARVFDAVRANDSFVIVEARTGKGPGYSVSEFVKGDVTVTFSSYFGTVASENRFRMSVVSGLRT